MALINDYFNKTLQYQARYGDKTLVLMQVGAFYEVYGLKDKINGEITGSKIEEFTRFCDLAISDKKVCVGKKSVVMAGFRDYVLDKYIRKIQDANFTAVVYSQDEKAAGTTRSLTGIFSPGTFFNTESNKITNNVMCIWIQQYKDNMIVGLSNIDIFTGKSSIFEYAEPFSRHCTSYDELERYVSIYNPSEVIIIHNLDNSLINNIINFASINTECIHKISLDIDNTNSIKAANCEKQIYQKEIVSKFYDDQVFNNNYNFFTYQIATQSFCYLLEFVYEHNPNLVRQIALPEFENCSDRLLLGNHSLKQLNIINSGIISGKNSSVVDFVNMCVTPMGKRRLTQNMVNPIFNIDKLTKEYDIIDYINRNCELKDNIRLSLQSIKDIEKLNRKLILKRITPQDLYYLYNNLNSIKDMYYTYTTTDKILNLYIHSFINVNITEQCESISSELKKYLQLDVCKDINNLDYDVNFINYGIDNKYDIIVTSWRDSYIILKSIQEYLNNIVKPYEKNSNSTDYIKIYHTDKMGYSLIATKRRIAILQDQLKNIGETIEITYKSWNGDSKIINLDIKSLTYTKSTTSNITIDSKQLSDFCKLILTSQRELSCELEKMYSILIKSLTEFSFSLNEIIKYVAIIDTITTKSHVAIKYNYCKPTIDTSKTTSFINVQGLRHPLIETLLENELYVTNDVVLDNELSGILLYGTNAVGKSSFIKSIGICVIMAQAGFFVPCSNMTYFPYKNIFTRILGNDNLFKGLSTFAVEMLELKTILEKSNEYSLVLGDELCSGTETDSAISIFIAGIDKLYNDKCNFIFATHFHEIVQYDEIIDKKRLSLQHMSVVYDKETDCLVYNRKLQDGSGESMYGLEVCKSLHLPNDFLSLAHYIRNKYNPTTKSILEYKTSHFNSKKIKGLCEICNNVISSEVHHLQHQEKAHENNFIESFHKNHVANLISVCNICHNKLHASEKGHTWKKTSKGHQLIEII